MLLELVGTSVKTRQLQITTFDDSPFYGCFRKSLFYAYFQIDIAHSAVVLTIIFFSKVACYY